MAGRSAPERLWPIGTPPSRFAPLFDSGPAALVTAERAPGTSHVASVALVLAARGREPAAPIPGVRRSGARERPRSGATRRAASGGARVQGRPGDRPEAEVHGPVGRQPPWAGRLEGTRLERTGHRLPVPAFDRAGLAYDRAAVPSGGSHVVPAVVAHRAGRPRPHRRP